MYAGECVGSLWRVQGACASQCHFLLSTHQPHLSLISYTLRQLLCARASSFPPEYDKKRQDDKLIKTINQCFSVFGLCCCFCNPRASIYLHHYNTPLPYFCRLLSLFPRFLRLYLSISIILLSVITPLLPPPPYHHHHASRLSLCLSPLCPSSFPLSLLKPVKGYQAPLSIRSNSIRSLPYESFFLLSKWALAAATVPNSFKGRQARVGEMDISIRSSSLSRSTPLKGNLFTLMDTFVWMYEGWTDEGVCK